MYISAHEHGKSNQEKQHRGKDINFVDKTKWFDVETLPI